MQTGLYFCAHNIEKQKSSEKKKKCKQNKLDTACVAPFKVVNQYILDFK